MQRFYWFLAFFLVLPALPLRADSAVDAPHVRVELLVPGNDLYPSDQLNDAGLYFKLEPGWHIYWKNPGDAGEPPHLRWTLPEGISAGPLEFPAPQRLPLGPLMDYGYEKEVLLPFKIHVATSVKGGPVTLRAKVDWLVCQNSCIPGKAELEVQRNVSTDPHAPAYRPDPLFKHAFTQLAKPLPASAKAAFEATANGFRLTVLTGRHETQAAFFPEDPDQIDNPAPQRLTPTENGLILELKKDAGLKAAPKLLRGVLELSGGRNFEIVAGAEPAAAVAAVKSVATGVPPSTLSPTTSAQTAVPAAVAPSAPSAPVLPVQQTAFSWVALLRATGLAFVGGLLLNLMPCVFPVLFLKGLALVNSGSEQLHRLRAHGLVYAAGILVSFWALVAALLGLRAAGATLGWGFQFQSPAFLALMGCLLFFLALSLAGQFEIGLTLTSAGGSLASKQGFTGSFFTGVLAVVVATPCTAPFMGAAIGYALAQPTAVTFAVFTALALGLAAPYLALTLNPAWTRILPRPGVWMEILRQAVAVPIFATVIWLAWVLVRAWGANILLVLLGAFLLLGVAGWFLGRWPTRRWSSAVAAVLLLAVVALCVGAEKLAGADSTQNSPAVSENSGGGWEPWSAEAVRRSQAEGRPVFVDFTASWCLSCQVNERTALAQPEVQAAFRDAHVTLLRADWTRRDPAITETLSALGRSGVPTYVLYAPGGGGPRLLPEVLTPGIVLDALASLPKSAATH